ncbi:hypothetical protein [Pontibacter lucknowensis]|uniref:Uncharacterized protein n=1 Tax=Pontibacter lucknowensis TaxID=1077936 RepID=A0A1N6Y1H4_9BACT|nr:hypothetical protein [Pontibacter lucknowensis]SIR08492.1 hypothetical protein SAMN05421545_2206 [Pontibacter lucknowensis]
MTESETPAILRNDYLEIQLGKQADVISVRWLRHPTSDEFRANNYLLADLLMAYECRRLLSDARAILYLELADQHWLMEQLIPLLSSTSLELHACVVSQISLELMDTDRLVKHSSGYASPSRKAIETRLFLNTSPARA